MSRYISEMVQDRDTVSMGC